jgi:hypothetical protein
MSRREPTSNPKYQEGQMVLMVDTAHYIRQRESWGGKPGVIDEVFWDEDWDGGEWWYGIGTPNGYHNTYPQSDLTLVGINKNIEAKSLLSQEW